MVVVLHGPIPDSERFVELIESDDTPPRNGSPTRPPRSAARGLQIFTVASSTSTHQQRGKSLERKNSRGSNKSRRNPVSSIANDQVEVNENNERFYSPDTTPVVGGERSFAANVNDEEEYKRLFKHRTSEIPLTSASPLGGKEAGVRRAFRSKTGTDGSVSLSILPSAAALTEMLENRDVDETSRPAGTYVPAAIFNSYAAASASQSRRGSLASAIDQDHADISTDHARRGTSVTSNENGHGQHADARGGNALSNQHIPIASELRSASAISTGSVNTKPLQIRRKKPAFYQPVDEALPVSRAASIDDFTEDGDFSTSVTAEVGGKRRTEAQLPVSQTFQTPLRRIPQSDLSPPSTPPAWGSAQSDSTTEEESLPISPRSSAHRSVGQKSAHADSRNPQHGANALSNTTSIEEGEAPEIVQRSTKDHGDSDYPMPFVCSLDEMRDRPGVLRDSDDDLSDMMDEESDTDEEEDDASRQTGRSGFRDFGLDNFPVPSVILTSPKNTNTPRMSGRLSNTASPSLITGFSPAGRKLSNLSMRSGSSRPKLYSVPTDANGVEEWDQDTELEVRDRVFRAEIKKPNKADKLRRKRLEKSFDQFTKPTKLDLHEASLLSVRDENGHKVRFGSLFEGKKTIVAFIRHFWCTQCHNYVDAVSKVRPEILEKHDVNLVIISNGSWKMIKSYKKLLGGKCPYPIYTDRGRHIYTSLGMTLRTWDAGKEKDRGSYIQHSLGGSIIAGITQGARLPIRPPGDQQQLGGEFVLGPGLEIGFVHRMKTTRGHAEIEDILKSIGIDLEEETKNLGLNNETNATAGASGSATPTTRFSTDSRRKSTGVETKSPSLAGGLMARLAGNTPRTSQSPRMSNGISSTSIATAVAASSSSPPGSPVSSSSFQINESAVVAAPRSPRVRTPSQRLKKKNRNSTTANVQRQSRVIISEPFNGSSSALPVDGSHLSLGNNTITKERPISSSTLPEEMSLFPSSISSPSFVGNNNDKQLDNLGNISEKHCEENDKARDSKRFSAPPKIPTPENITPLSLGFLQLPSSWAQGTPPARPAPTPPLFPIPGTARRLSISNTGEQPVMRRLSVDIL